MLILWAYFNPDVTSDKAAVAEDQINSVMHT